MSMDIYATPGTQVKYIGATDMQVSYRGYTDPRPLLEEGQIVTVKRTEVFDCYTNVYFEEVDGRFNSCSFADLNEILDEEEPIIPKVNITSTKVKDHIGGFVHFVCYGKGELWYRTDSGLEFPVPIDDTGDGIFLNKDKAMLFMRYIRKHLANIEEGKKECQGGQNDRTNTSNGAS